MTRGSSSYLIWTVLNSYNSSKGASDDEYLQVTRCLYSVNQYHVILCKENKVKILHQLKQKEDPGVENFKYLRDMIRCVPALPYLLNNHMEHAGEDVKCTAKLKPREQVHNEELAFTLQLASSEQAFQIFRQFLLRHETL